ncbi:MAG: FAD-binding oxidoreductase [Aquabacterium sp.]|jgi:FAD/FMN-containing dehydrogenase
MSLDIAAAAHAAATDAARWQLLRHLVGDAHVLQAEHLDEHHRRRHLHDWRGRYQGRCRAVVSPGSTQEVQSVVRACQVWGWPLVPQGGNTSLVGGSVPDASGQHLVLYLGRLRQVRQLDANNLTITVEAGCTLDEVRQHAAQAGWLFPLSLASGGQCTIGGNLATNAGGTQVLRYGTARELCLGLEVVTAQGDCWSQLAGLRKNNTGYDLKDLFIGSEGTLGVITAATLKLFPAPRGTATALLRCPDAGAAVALLTRARQRLDAGLVAFEAMAPRPLALVQEHLPEVTRGLGPWSTPDGPSSDHPASATASAPGGSSATPPAQLNAWLVLIEHVGPRETVLIEQELAELLEQAQHDGLIQDAWLAGSLAQQQALWRLRESIPLAEKAEGLMVKHDIGLPTSVIPQWLAQCEQALLQRWPGCQVVCFGHLGDGNLHYNVQAPAELRQGAAFEQFERDVNTVVFDLVQAHGGTLSAEHGIGALRRDELARRAPPEGLAMMRAIKQALDPQGLFNPGRLIPPGSPRP